VFTDELYHHGVKGQKWGIRRYQNPDGTHTPLGRQKDRLRKGRKSKKRQPLFKKIDRIYASDKEKAEELKDKIAMTPISELKEITEKEFMKMIGADEVQVPKKRKKKTKNNKTG
jgi:hypothetical protein